MGEKAVDSREAGTAKEESSELNTSVGIPLVRASVLQPFLHAAKRIGTPVESRLRSAGLPGGWVDNDAHLLPELQAWRFIQEVSGTEGVEDFGLLSAKAIPHPRLTTLAPLLVGCATLLELLNRFIAVAPWQSNVTAYKLVPKSDALWFVHTGDRLITGDVQVSIFQLFGMLQVVRCAAGKTWLPSEIHMPFPRQEWMQSHADLGLCRLRFSRPNAAFPIPRKLLAKPISWGRASDAPVTAEISPVESCLEEQLLVLMTTYLGREELTIELIGELAGVSARTLQRRLARQKTTFTSLLGRARLLVARKLIDETDLSLVEIAMATGYENHSSFTRAFRQWAGVSPSEYRFCAPR